MKTSKTNVAKASILAASVLFSAPLAHSTLLSQDKSSVSRGIKMGGEANIVNKTISNLKYEDIYIKIREDWNIVGVDKGNTVYKNTRGEYFTIDPNTGDMKTMASDYYLKFTYIKMGAARSAGKLSMIKFDGIKGEMKVKVLGVDNKGNVIQKNSKGEKFYLDPNTGDMVTVK